MIPPAARGEIATVRVWHLRPSLVWKDGEWVESCSSIGRASNEVPCFSLAFVCLPCCNYLETY